MESQDVDTRVVEHNIRVVAKCYSKIRSDRLASLLDKSPDETEENLSRLVVDKSVYVTCACFDVCKQPATPRPVVECWEAVPLDANWLLYMHRYAKIDRPNKIVSFREAADASGQLNSWAGNISGLLSLVEQSCHLIAREEMIAKSKKGKR